MGEDGAEEDGDVQVIGASIDDLLLISYEAIATIKVPGVLTEVI